jgi:hypothetical protein
MESTRVRLIVGYSIITVGIIGLLLWIRQGVSWGRNDTVGVFLGLFIALIVCTYITRVWDFSNLKPYSDQTMTAEQGLNNWVFPMVVFFIGILSALTTQFFSVDFVEVMTMVFMVTSIGVLVFMIVKAYIHR